MGKTVSLRLRKSTTTDVSGRMLFNFQPFQFAGGVRDVHLSGHADQILTLGLLEEALEGAADGRAGLPFLQGLAHPCQKTLGEAQRNTHVHGKNCMTQEYECQIIDFLMHPQGPRFTAGDAWFKALGPLSFNEVTLTDTQP